VAEETRTQTNEDGLGPVLNRNIDALREWRARNARETSPPDRIAHRISPFAGSMNFVAVHGAALIGWTAWNIGLVPGVAPFDPSFVILATAASVEAIFLSTFILVSQNRAAAEQDRRHELDLQISLLAEHEITRILRLVTAMAEKAGIGEAKRPDLGKLERDVAPEAVLDTIERKEDPRRR